jgi:2',3'-cyclic-nucleotide 2'-phosphodiesterase (5'-nucleotidase family)
LCLVVNYIISLSHSIHSYDNITLGGAARIGAVIKSLRTKATLAGKEPIVLHGGDAVTGTLFYSVFKSRADAAFMNAVGFDAQVAGNHEFDDGDSGLAAYAGLSNTPILSYNRKYFFDWDLLFAVIRFARINIVLK